MTRSVISIQNNKVLLFDDAFTAEKRGFSLTLSPPIQLKEPLLVCDRPWEIGGLCGNSNLSIIQEDGTYRLWYGIELLEANAAGHASGAKEFDGKLDGKTLADLRSGERKYALCHAVSTDGIHWEKPSANVIRYGRSRKNNMVIVGRLGCTVFKDPVAPPSQRYKMIYGGGPRLPHVHLVEDIPVQHIYHAIYGAYSSDGIHWTPYPHPIIPWYTDTTNVAYYDEQKGKYVAFVRMNEGMIYHEGRTITPDKGARLRYRTIGRTESEDFARFPAPTRILEPTPQERRDYARGLDLYNSAAAKYPFAPDTYFLFPSYFYHEPDTLDAHLCTSRDGIHYRRWQEPFIRPGIEGSFDSRSIYVAAGIVRHEDELRLYYAGYDHTHGGYFARKPFTGGIGMARLRLDGFVAQEARWSGGELVTVPLRFQGSRLLLNMDANAGGWLKVELRDAKNRPITAFAEQNADKLWGNHLAKPATWQGSDNVRRLAGKPIRLRFVGRGVKLFAFQFV